MHTSQAVADSGLSPSQHAHFHPLVAEPSGLAAPPKEKPLEEGVPPKEKPVDVLGFVRGVASVAVSLLPNAKPSLTGAELLAFAPLETKPPLARKERPPEAEPEANSAGLLASELGGAPKVVVGSVLRLSVAELNEKPPGGAGPKENAAGLLDSVVVSDSFFCASAWATENRFSVVWPARWKPPAKEKLAEADGASACDAGEENSDDVGALLDPGVANRTG
jgi:hypothetical protein